MIRAGDLVSCSNIGIGILSSLISRITRSGYTHTQIVVECSQNPTARPMDFYVLEVGWKIRIEKFSDLNRGEFRIDRPLCPPGESQYAWGEKVGADVKSLVRQLQEAGKDRYPWWKLPLYLIRSREWRGKLIREGPRQVCSVMSIRPLVARGWELWVWDRNGRRKVDTHDEVQTVVPAGIVRFFVESGQEPVYITDNAPVI